jgi:hypothetical protein
MNASKNTYHIVDEPNFGPHHKLIVNPLVILMVSIFLPLVWVPPFMGKFWMPFVWLVVNSYLLGSPTFWKECLISVGSAITLLAVFFVSIIVVNSHVEIERAGPYIRLGLMATLFLFLYLVVFMQMKSYSIYEYIQQNSEQ